MKRHELIIGKRYKYVGNTVIFGELVKIKPYAAVLEVWDIETGEIETHEISCNRLERIDT